MNQVKFKLKSWLQKTPTYHSAEKVRIPQHSHENLNILQSMIFMETQQPNLLLQTNSSDWTNLIVLICRVYTALSKALCFKTLLLTSSRIWVRLTRHCGILNVSFTFTLKVCAACYIYVLCVHPCAGWVWAELFRDEAQVTWLIRDEERQSVTEANTHRDWRQCSLALQYSSTSDQS